VPVVATHSATLSNLARGYYLREKFGPPRHAVGSVSRPASIANRLAATIMSGIAAQRAASGSGTPIDLSACGAISSVLVRIDTPRFQTKRALLLILATMARIAADGPAPSTHPRSTGSHQQTSLVSVCKVADRRSETLRVVRKVP